MPSETVRFAFYLFLFNVIYPYAPTMFAEPLAMIYLTFHPDAYFDGRKDIMPKTRELVVDYSFATDMILYDVDI